MPIGSNAQQNGLGVSGTVTTTVGDITAGTNASAKVQRGDIAQQSGSSANAPYVIVGIIILYALYALVLQHQKVSETLRPANVAVNVHNFIVGGIAAVIFIVVAKIASTKLAAFGVPGAASVAQVIHAA